MSQENGKIQNNPREKFSFWYDPAKRGLLIQLIVGMSLFTLLVALVVNTQKNLNTQNIATGFDFLSSEAGFQISEKMIKYGPWDTYALALGVGLLNTLKIAFVGNFFAILLGVIIGIGRLGHNWILAKLSEFYIELIRNIPLLLQLFFWYALITEVFPNVHDSFEILPHIYLNQRGLYFPRFFEEGVLWGMGLSFFFGLILLMPLKKLILKKKDYVSWFYYIIPFVLPLIIGGLYGNSAYFDYPLLGKFNYEGGASLSPEYFALLIGLILYTAAFNAEIVRAGIESISKGQWEAAESLGLNRVQTLRYIILPQSLRVILPPLTSQILNLVKNSSLAIAIGYPDFVAVANTTLNQTGQAIESVILIMGVYLFFSLSISMTANYFSRKWEYHS